MKTSQSAVVYMMYSSLFLSLLNFSVKGCIGPLGVMESTFLRYFAPLVLLVPILAWKGTLYKLKPEVALRLHLLRGFCAVVAQLSLNYYMTRASLVNATMLWGTAPIFVPIIAHFLYKQKTPLVTWISIGICLVGVIMMIKPTDGIFDPFSIWGIVAGIATAFTQLLWGQNVEKGSVTENLFYLYVFASGLALTVWLIFGDQGKSTVPNTALLWVAIGGMAMTSLGNQFFRSKAYKLAPSFLLTPVLYSAVVGAGILDVIFYRHVPDMWGFIGFGVVAAGTFLKWWYLKNYYSQTTL